MTFRRPLPPRVRAVLRTVATGGRTGAAFVRRHRREIAAITWRAGYWASVAVLAGAGTQAVASTPASPPGPLPFLVGLLLAAPAAVVAPTIGRRTVAAALGTAHALLAAALDAAGPWG